MNDTKLRERGLNQKLDHLLELFGHLQEALSVSSKGVSTADSMAEEMKAFKLSVMYINVARV